MSESPLPKPDFTDDELGVICLTLIPFLESDQIQDSFLITTAMSAILKTFDYLKSVDHSSLKMAGNSEQRALLGDIFSRVEEFREALTNMERMRQFTPPGMEIGLKKYDG